MPRKKSNNPDRYIIKLCDAPTEEDPGRREFRVINGENKTRLKDRASRLNLVLTEWVTCGSLAEAQMRAGFPQAGERSWRHRFVRRYPEAALEVRRRRDLLTKKIDLSQESVIIELARLAFGNIGNVVQWVDGKPVIADSDMLSDDVKAAIQEIKVDANGAMSVKMYDKKGALVDLGKFMGLAQASDVDKLIAAIRGEKAEEAEQATMDTRQLARRAALLLRQGKLASLSASAPEKAQASENV